MFPVVAPGGTGAMIAVSVQLMGDAATPLKVTALLSCDAPNPAAVIVTQVPTVPVAGNRLEILGTLVLPEDCGDDGVACWANKAIENKDAKMAQIPAIVGRT